MTSTLALPHAYSSSSYLSRRLQVTALRSVKW